MIVDKLKLYRLFILFATVLLVAIFIVEKINGRFWLNDFKVYYSAAHALIKGEQVYGVPFGLDTGFYKYSPLVAMLFVPYTFLSYKIAAIIHFFVLAVATILTVILSSRLISKYFQAIQPRAENILMILALLCIALHLVRELHLGNINMLLLLLASSGLMFALQSKNVLSGILIGLAIIIKPYLLILVLPFMASGKWRVIISISLTMIASFLIPVLAVGFWENILLHTEWVDSMLAHSHYLSSHHTIQSLLNYYSGLQTGTRVTYILMTVICTGSLFIFFLLKHPFTSQFLFIAGYFCLLAIVPNIVVTDTEHFLLSLPLIVILLRYIAERKKTLLTAAFIILIFFYEGNSSDLLGKNLSGRFEEMGLLGISNLIIIASVLMLVFSTARKSSQIKAS